MLFRSRESVVKVNIPVEAYSFFGTRKENIKKATPMLIGNKAIVNCNETGLFELQIEAYAGEIYKLH